LSICTFAEAYPDETQFTQQAVAQIPWGHHCIILVGVASYQFTTSLPEPLKNQLPDVKLLEASLQEVKKHREEE
jgi:hypothetical protein